MMREVSDLMKNPEFPEKTTITRFLELAFFKD